MTATGGPAVWDAGAGRDPRREALDLEAAIRDVLARNTRLPDHRITVRAGPDGLVTLTGSVPTQDLRREVELSCGRYPGSEVCTTTCTSVTEIEVGSIIGRLSAARGRSR